MRRIVFRSIADLSKDPVEVFWLRGLVRNERNEWNVRVVYRVKGTNDLIPVEEPIGMFPLLSPGIWFEHGQMRTDELPGSDFETIVPDTGRPEILTSADLPHELLPLPKGTNRAQRLFHYRTAKGDVLVPVIELVRAMFIHNRALALALMRPAGLEQLYAPLMPGWSETATIRFTREIDPRAIGRSFALEFAWIALDPDARRAWDSIQRLSMGQEYVLFEPPSIQNSLWTFRGTQRGRQCLVLELTCIGGRRLPFRKLEYSHPGFVKAMSAGGDTKDVPGSNDRRGTRTSSAEPDIDVDDKDGSGSYHTTKIVSLPSRRSVFENDFEVAKIQRAWSEKPRPRKKKAEETRKAPDTSTLQAFHVTTGERSETARLVPLEFKTLALAPLHDMGDLVALDETVRHMRAMRPGAAFSVTLVQLEQGRAAASTGSRPRVAMLVTIEPPGKPPIVLIDFERTGISALSVMAMRFRRNVIEEQVENSIRTMIDGWINSGGHWSGEKEEELQRICRCERLPKALIPRKSYSEKSKDWAKRLLGKLGLPA
ncbi:MAG TPA: hypothetical protein PLV07_01110 [Acidiphilium sp.]|uniref:hypothetical protein n=1 Tax=unclassified Acidiphilium TaxID=2617493 RepID=UPI000BCB5DC8|nr:MULTISPECIES: hypothetical protein [unclassified Acidiphilium]OYV55641.1 MAG: hypothetical protein B7Z76_09295 [Acidiphilium sp. 20-67-58]HQT61411.1 hypothetical protein [Acidiphilium sp.]HQU10152.1 hypothetical protein [Acidiphilium sp.]